MHYCLTMRSKRKLIESAAQKALVQVARNFLGIYRAYNNSELVDNVLKAYLLMGARMSLKINFFHSYLNSFFPSNLGIFSDEHQDIKVTGNGY